ncbi:unnamed protein product [Moneuplotes crassus]|uniref:Uncharacterized protein n=1 Tax=Euplotes crassus TaxID=5936 RepID=A0AAD2D791_EUPCR|nr:unnamed protein product [Moneuplotes crassus]
MIADIILNSFGNFMSMRRGYVDDNSVNPNYDDKLGEILAIIFHGLQVIIQLSILFWVFFLFWKTFLFQYGLILSLIKEFPLLMTIVLFNIVFLIGERFSKLWLQFLGNDKIAIYDLYDSWYYRTAYYIRNMITPIAYGVCLKSSITVGDPDLYKPYKWIRH